jgi:hypothetical protein
VRRFDNASDGAYPSDTPLLAAGTLYMTTSGNEPASFGSLDELVPPADGHTGWQEKTGFVFTNDANSGNPTGTLIERDGVVYGTTLGAGSGPAPYGTVFAFKP